MCQLPELVSRASSAGFTTPAPNRQIPISPVTTVACYSAMRNGICNFDVRLHYPTPPKNRLYAEQTSRIHAELSSVYKTA